MEGTRPRSCLLESRNDLRLRVLQYQANRSLEGGYKVRKEGGIEEFLRQRGRGLGLTIVARLSFGSKDGTIKRTHR